MFSWQKMVIPFVLLQQMSAFSIFFNENDDILIRVSLKFAPKAPISNKLTLAENQFIALFMR